MHFETIRDLNNALRVLYAKDDIHDLVFGDGPVPCRIMIAGEAPGADEIRTGRPFTGQAGRNFDGFLEKLGLTRDDIYIGNTCKFRPFRVSDKGTTANRPPTTAEVRRAMPYLHEEVRLVNPTLLITLGNTPLHACTGDFALRVGDVHGRVLPQLVLHGVPLFALYHPASIIYSPGLRETYEEDLASLRAYLDAAGL